MSKICEVCGKKPAGGNTVAHSKVTTRRWWKPNIQRVKVLTPEGTKRIHICTSCLSAGKVTRA